MFVEPDSMPEGNHSAYDRVVSIGVRGASSFDLMALALASKPAEIAAAERRAHELMQAVGRIRNVSELSRATLEGCGGLDEFGALRVMACLELGRRLSGAAKGPSDEIAGPEDVVALLGHLRDEKREHFVAVHLDAKGRVMRTVVVHVGTLTASMVGPREVFREAVRDGACSLIVAHNHPSGDPEPSPEDIAATGRLREVGELLDIPVLDHVILGDPGYVSLRERGWRR